MVASNRKESCIAYISSYNTFPIFYFPPSESLKQAAKLKEYISQQVSSKIMIVTYLFTGQIWLHQISTISG